MLGYEFDVKVTYHFMSKLWLKYFREHHLLDFVKKLHESCEWRIYMYSTCPRFLAVATWSDNINWTMRLYLTATTCSTILNVFNPFFKITFWSPMFQLIMLMVITCTYLFKFFNGIGPGPVMCLVQSMSDSHHFIAPVIKYWSATGQDTRLLI